MREGLLPESNPGEALSELKALVLEYIHVKGENGRRWRMQRHVSNDDIDKEKQLLNNILVICTE